MFDANKKLKDWRKAVAHQVAQERHATWHETFESFVPVSVQLIFYMRKPKTAKREFPTVKPDIDKLIRAVFDGMTEARVWVDDSQVVSLSANMVYCKENDTPKVFINCFAKRSIEDLD